MIVHLISPVEGTVSRINHEDEIRSLPSFIYMHLEPEVGGPIVRTVNIRTDSGYVLLQHADAEVVEADYRRVCELQSTIFEVGESSVTSSTSEEGVQDRDRDSSMISTEKHHSSDNQEYQHQQSDNVEQVKEYVQTSQQYDTTPEYLPNSSLPEQMKRSITEYTHAAVRNFKNLRTCKLRLNSAYRHILS